jgi:alkyldihydroxyacetonephosphate synthase
MDYGLITDTLETATVWANVLPLYELVRQRMQACVPEVTGHAGYYLGCHLSHFYATGVCLYFTVGALATAGSTPEQMLEQYLAIKSAGTQAIMDGGGTLSHHHAVGYEHQPWMTQEHSPAALESLHALKAFLDPTAILNPGSLLPPTGGQIEEQPFFRPLGP